MKSSNNLGQFAREALEEVITTLLGAQQFLIGELHSGAPNAINGFQSAV